MRGIVDRLEGEWLIVELETEEFVSLPRKILPEAKDGDVVFWGVDVQKTEERRARLRELRRKLTEDEAE